MNAGIILIVPFLQSPVIMAVHLTTLVINVLLASLSRRQVLGDGLVLLMIVVGLEKGNMLPMMFIFGVVMDVSFLAIEQGMVELLVFLHIITAEHLVRKEDVVSNYFCSRAETISSVTFLASPYSIIVLSAKNNGFSTPE